MSGRRFKNKGGQTPSCVSDHGGGHGTPRHLINNVLQRKLSDIAIAAGFQEEKKPHKRAGESRATFWVCKCGRTHKVRWESGKVCVSLCPLCSDYYRG